MHFLALNIIGQYIWERLISWNNKASCKSGLSHSAGESQMTIQVGRWAVGRGSITRKASYRGKKIKCNLKRFKF